MKKILVFLLVSIFLINCISAYEFDNMKYYDSNTKEVTIKNAFGLGETISKIRLNTPLENKVGLGYQKVAEFEITNYKDYENVLQDIEFFNVKNGEKINIDFDYKYKTIEEVSQYENVCSDNSTCVKEIIGKESLEKWNDLKDFNFKKEKIITIGIFTEVKEGDKVEWIPTMYGREINEWATWSASLNTDLILYYKFDETTGTTAKDEIGNYNGTLVNMDNTNWITGKVGNAINFTGTDELLNTTYARNITMADSVSMNFWFKDNVWEDGRMGSFRSTLGEHVFNILTEGAGADTGRFYIRDGSNQIGVTSTTDIADNNWHMITVIRNRATDNLSIYVDGVSETNVTDTTTATINLYQYPLFLGAEDNDGAGANFMTVSLDEFVFWNRTLTEAEIDNLYNGGSGQPYIAESNITLNSPSGENITSRNYTFNASLSGGADDLVNSTTYIWYANNTLFNLTLTNVTGTTNFTNVTINNLPILQSMKWGVSECTASTCMWSTQNYTFVVISTYNNFTYNSTSFETAAETLSINITPISGNIPTSAYLVYNNVPYSATITSAGSQYIINKTIDVTNGAGNKEFYFNWSYGGLIENSTAYNQTVNATYFTLCNTTYLTSFLNLTFKDESDSSNINASLPLSEFTYYLGSGAVTKSYTFINNSNNYYYNFCATPNQTIYVDGRIQYESTGYPQRVWNPSVTTYTNTSTTQVLYLLNSVDGLYVTFQVVNPSEVILTNVSILATREIDSSTITVGQGVTGDDGIVTFWLNPDFVHTFTFEKTGFTTYTTSFAPTQSSYTITLGGSTTVPQSYFKGMNKLILPTNSSLTNDTAYTFGFQLNSSYWSLTEYGFNIRLSNGTEISGGTSSTSGTTLTKVYNTNNQTRIYLDYYWIVNGTTVSDTIYWNVYNTQYSQWSIKTFFTDLNLYISSDLFGLDNFGKSLIIFLILFITIGTLTYKYGVSSPVFIVAIIFGVIFFFDVGVGLIPDISFSGRAIPNLLTFISGLMLVIVILREVQS